jgi:hypothetical protein
LNRRAILLIAAAVGLVIVLAVGVRLSRSDYAAAAWFTTLLLLIIDGLVALHFMLGGGANAIRRGALISVLVTLGLIGNCSATGVASGSASIAADPLTYLATLLILVGPLVVVLAVPAIIATVSPTPRTVRWILVACVLGGVAAVVTAYAGFVLSYAVFCTNSHSNAAQNAQCVASSGSLAAIFGLIGPVMVLPPLLVLMRRLGSGSPAASKG